MQYSQEHLKRMVYAEFGGQTECIMGNWKIENFCQEWPSDAGQVNWVDAICELRTEELIKRPILQ